MLNALLEKYAAFGPKQFEIPDALQVTLISKHGNGIEITNLFGGGAQIKTAVDRMQALLYLK